MVLFRGCCWHEIVNVPLRALGSTRVREVGYTSLTGTASQVSALRFDPRNCLYIHAVFHECIPQLGAPSSLP